MSLPCGVCDRDNGIRHKVRLEHHYKDYVIDLVWLVCHQCILEMDLVVSACKHKRNNWRLGGDYKQLALYSGEESDMRECR